ncbi:hypothetical protein IH992_20205 [Candidatus Poribacteria bacterium]|nr:hypothetical protein [Candidatus Poribacteria bacterium]
MRFSVEWQFEENVRHDLLRIDDQNSEQAVVNCNGWLGYQHLCLLGRIGKVITQLSQ